MEIANFSIGMRVQDGYKFGIVTKIFKKTVWVQWSSDKLDYWIYDLDHLQFLKGIK